MRCLLEEAHVGLVQARRDERIAHHALAEEDFIPDARAQILARRAGVMTIDVELVAAILLLRHAPANVEGMFLVGQGGLILVLEVILRVRLVAPLRVRVGEVEGVAHRESVRAQLDGDGRVGAGEHTIHVGLLGWLADLRRGDGEARVIHAIRPSLMHQQRSLRRVLLDEVVELLGERPVGREVVALETRLLDSHEVPRLGAQHLFQALLV